MTTHIPRIRWGVLLPMAATMALLGGPAVSGVTAAPAHSQTEQVQLDRGCNNVALTWRDGTPATTVTKALVPAAAIASVWRFNSATQRFEGFAPALPQASDLATVDRLDAVFLCVTAPATLTRPLMVLAGD